MCKKMQFSYMNFQKSPYRGTLPPLGLFAPSLWIPVDKSGCTTVIGIAKGHKCPPPSPPPPPVDWSYKKRGSKEWVYATTLTTLIMAFNEQENFVFIHKTRPTPSGVSPDVRKIHISSLLEMDLSSLTLAL